MTRALLGAAALGAATLATRLPFLSQHLWAWDSVLYARALEQGFHVDYALQTQRPHPPGYFFYVETASLARRVVEDSNLALVLISAVASALAVAALYLLARRFAGERIALLCAIGFACAPLVWQYSEIAYPYTVLAFFSIAIATAFWEARRRGAVATIAASLFFGLAAGFRQDLLLILAPLWLWTLLPLGRRWQVVAFFAIGLGTLAWLAPTAALSGGLERYLVSVLRQADYVRDTYSVQDEGLAALVTNLGTTVYALAWGLGPFVLPILAAALPAVRSLRSGAEMFGPRERFLALWAGPAIAFYVLVHIGEWGYVLSVVPALYVVAARSSEVLLAASPRWAIRPARLAAPALVVVGAALFLLAPAPFSSAALARYDNEIGARVDYVRSHFAATNTLILARDDFLQVRYYLPEYRIWFHDPDPYHPAIHRRRTKNVAAIVVFTPGLVADNALGAQTLQCRRDVQLVYLPVESDSVVEFYGPFYTVRGRLGME